MQEATADDFNALTALDAPRNMVFLFAGVDLTDQPPIELGVPQDLPMHCGGWQTTIDAFLDEIEYQRALPGYSTEAATHTAAQIFTAMTTGQEVPEEMLTSSVKLYAGRQDGFVNAMRAHADERLLVLVIHISDGDHHQGHVCLGRYDDEVPIAERVHDLIHDALVKWASPPTTVH